MAKVLDTPVVESSEWPSGLTFEQAKVHFLYAFYLNGWRQLAHDFSQSGLWREAWGINEEHRQLAWIARQLGIRNETLKYVNVHEADGTGTRPFLRRLDPFIEIELVPERLSPQNCRVMPELAAAVKCQSIQVTPAIRLYYSGFGILCLKTNFSTTKGQDLAVREIVYSADDSVLPPLKPSQADHVIERLTGLLAQHSQELPRAALLNCLESLKDPNKERCIADRITDLASRRTPIVEPLGPTSVIQISNLDRGTGPLHQPTFTWKGQKEKYPQHLYGYFVHVINDLVAGPIAHGLGVAGFKLNEPLSLSDHWHAEGGQHPYVSIFLPEYGDPDGDVDYAAAAAAFHDRVKTNKEQLARILLRTSWNHVRHDSPPLKEALENLFYSDLLQINVHLRSTLCYYYLPSSFDSFDELPELRNSYKYREELGKILGNQRLLWYAYTMFDVEASQSIKRFTRQFDQMMECCIEEEDFKHMVNKLREVVQGIDSFKTAVAQLMIDPQSRKGGSSLFTEILDRTSDAFHLPELYSNLRDKLDRLDMLGVHVTQTLHECSQLRVAEGTRSTQLTLEFLEAIILAFYLTDLVHNLKLDFIEAAGEKIFIPLLTVGAFLTGLPWITMIRKTFAQFEVPEPRWLERFLTFGAFAGPAILSFIGIMSLFVIESEQADKIAFAGLGWLKALYAGLILLAYAIIAGGWWVLEKRRHRGAVAAAEHAVGDEA